MDGIIKTEWVPIIGSTKEEGEDFIADFIDRNPDTGCWLVYLRCKYKNEKAWEYLVEAVTPYYTNEDLMWFNDWWEGQEDVEYIAISSTQTHEI